MATLRMNVPIPRDDRPVFDVLIETEGRRSTLRGMNLREAIGKVRDLALTMREGDELIVSDPDGRIHYKETSGSVYFRK